MAEFSGTPAASTQYAPFESASLGSVQQALGKPVVFDNFSYTHAAGAGTGEINLLKLPPGKYHIYPELSFISFSQFGANADAHLGHRAYHNADGTAVVADDNEWIDNGDVGGAARSGPWTGGFETGVNGTTSAAHADYDAADGLTIYLMIDTGDIEDTDTVSGWIAYTKLR
jgi:hypothetical protein